MMTPSAIPPTCAACSGVPIPNPTLGGGGGLILAIKASGKFVYVGGAFTEIGGQARNNLAKLSATSGNAVARFSPNPDDAVFALALSLSFAAATACSSGRDPADHAGHAHAAPAAAARAAHGHGGDDDQRGQIRLHARKALRRRGCFASST